jgi:hypothetical protein
MSNRWGDKEPKVDLFVDDLMVIYIKEGVPKVAIEALDGPFRAYMHWIHRCQTMKVDPVIARKAMLDFISSAIMQAAKRMGEVDEDGNRLPLETWLGEFVLDLRDELIADLEDVKGGRSH